MSDPIKHVHSFIDTHKLIVNKSPVIIGLSGGPDSVFLFYVLLQLAQEKKYTLIAAHLDHEWRTDSARDAEFCHKLASQYGITCIIKKAHELGYTPKNTGSLEDKGRELRRYFFEQCAQEYQAQAIALAHHADDQQETFFIRLIRGATLTGLTGMKPHNGQYIRPLLELHKSEILNHLHTHSIPYCTDPTNEQNTYLRNRIRGSVLPALRECDQRFNNNFAKTMSHLQQTEDFLDKLTLTSFKGISEQDDSFLWLSIKKLQALNPIIQQRIILQWLIQEQVPFSPSMALIQEILRFFTSQKSASHSLLSNVQILKKRGKVRIEKDS